MADTWMPMPTITRVGGCWGGKVMLGVGTLPKPGDAPRKRLTQGDRVLPVLISQATIVSKDNLNREEYRRATETDYVGMTMPVLLQTWLEMNRIIQEVSEQNSAIFVDGYNAVPHDFNCLEDHVHLTTQGCDILARAIAATLLNDKRFLNLAHSLVKK